MHKKSIVVILSLILSGCSYMEFDEELLEDFKSAQGKKYRSGWDAFLDGAIMGAMYRMRNSEIRERQYLQEQYLAQQIEYEERMIREEEERQRQTALYYYLHSKHRSPTFYEKKQADEITDSLNKN